MSIKNLAIVATAAAALMVSACSKHPATAASNTKTPVPGPAASDNNNGRQQTASNSGDNRRSTASSNSNSGMSKADRDSLNARLAKLEDVLFDCDKSTIRPDASKTLEVDVTAIRTILNKYPSQKVKIEGNADERGSDEYNVALGDKRAEAAKEFLTSMGINGGQLEVLSYGKQKPICTDHTEDCWQKNRRVHFVAQGASD